MDQMTNQTPKNQGWGVDLTDRVGVPREGNAQGKTGAHWEEPEQQIPKVKIYKTVERAKITPVFGSTCPPKGLSGVVRDVAYGYSENTLRRWMLLLFADRIDMFEGIVEDVFSGRLPHLIKEMGLAAELHNRQGFAARMSRSRSKGGPPAKGLIFAGVAAAGLAFYLWKKKADRQTADL